MRQRCKGEVRVLGPGGTPVIGPGNENGPTATAFPQVSPNGKCRTAPTGPSGTYEENLTISQVPIAGPSTLSRFSRSIAESASRSASTPLLTLAVSRLPARGRLCLSGVRSKCAHNIYYVKSRLYRHIPRTLFLPSGSAVHGHPVTGCQASIGCSWMICG